MISPEKSGLFILYNWIIFQGIVYKFISIQLNISSSSKGCESIDK